MNKDIQEREDIALLITTFYAKVRADKDLGPIFNSIIDDWDSHIDRLTDFWETNLFIVPKFKGNPIVVHQQTDQKVNYHINNVHFGIWLRLWINTIDELYHGDIANLAKNRARKIATTLFLKIFENKKREHENV